MEGEEKVYWMTVNGKKGGIPIDKVSPDDLLVRLDNGKCVIVNKYSLL